MRELGGHHRQALAQKDLNCMVRPRHQAMQRSLHGQGPGYHQVHLVPGGRPFRGRTSQKSAQADLRILSGSRHFGSTKSPHPQTGTRPLGPHPMGHGARNLPSVQQRQVFKASLQTSPCVLVMLWATLTDGLPSDAPSVSSSARSPSSSTSKRAARTPLALTDGWPRHLELTQHRTLLLKTITGQTMPRVMT